GHFVLSPTHWAIEFKPELTCVFSVLQTNALASAKITPTIDHSTISMPASSRIRRANSFQRIGSPLLAARRLSASVSEGGLDTERLLYRFSFRSGTRGNNWSHRLDLAGGRGRKSPSFAPPGLAPVGPPPRASPRTCPPRSSPRDSGARAAPRARQTRVQKGRRNRVRPARSPDTPPCGAPCSRRPPPPRPCRAASRRARAPPRPPPPPRAPRGRRAPRARAGRPRAPARGPTRPPPPGRGARGRAGTGCGARPRAPRP